MSVAMTGCLDGRVQAMTPACNCQGLQRDARSAFEDLYIHHKREIAAYVHRRVGGRHATEDIVADTFCRAWLAWPKFQERGIGPRPWLYRIASNVVNERLRKERLQRKLLFTRRATQPAASTTSHSQEDDPSVVRQALLRLPLKQQTVLSLYYLQGLSIRDIAAATSCPEGTVKSRLSRARKALEAELVKQEINHEQRK